MKRPAAARLRTLLLFAVFAAGTVRGRTVTFELLHTTDVHTFLDSTDQLDGGGGGWLRLATLIRRERRKWGADRVLLIDSGDTCQGTLAGVVTRGRVGVDLIHTLNYQVWAPGNHDLDFGVWRFYELTQNVRDRVLCANLTLQVDADRVRFAAWRMFTPAGAKVAVIGATARRLDDWLWGRTLLGFRVESAVTALKRVMPGILDQHPDVIVLAIHQGWLSKDPRRINEVAEIVRQFPEIDVILGGHTHRTFQGMKLGAKTWYVQSGCHGAWLGAVQVTADTREHRVVNVASGLIEAGPDVPEDPQAKAAVQDCLDRTRKTARTVIVRLPAPVPARGTPGETCATSELICRAVAEATGARIVFHGKLSQKSLPAGPVTEQDLFDLVPYENSLAVAQLTSAELRKVLEEQWAWRGSGAYSGAWGIEAVFSSEGRLREIRNAFGKPLDEKKRLAVAFNSYTVAGAGRRFPVLRALLRTPQAELRDTGINSRDAVRTYLKRHRPLRLTPRRWVRRVRRR
ncbi:MAG: bifunctional metallophosphatase/5'-nucleotidase [Kiritimatiellaeota bacterium]|nr:bifunctional metallophosphatase/5'-nucleotidase [Kiritimatiellota bacterium]